VPRIVAPRLALAGEATHGIHSLSGHGVNLGFQDAEALAERLTAAPLFSRLVNVGLTLTARALPLSTLLRAPQEAEQPNRVTPVDHPAGGRRGIFRDERGNHNRCLNVLIPLNC
jgi:2-polyprenyl-6-methoxyphenol hydroxylase-like FAD-dependent oxidoreductase